MENQNDLENIINQKEKLLQEIEISKKSSKYLENLLLKLVIIVSKNPHDLINNIDVENLIEQLSTFSNKDEKFSEQELCNFILETLKKFNPQEIKASMQKQQIQYTQHETQHEDQTNNNIEQHLGDIPNPLVTIGNTEPEKDLFSTEELMQWKNPLFALNAVANQILSKQRAPLGFTSSNNSQNTTQNTNTSSITPSFSE